MAMVKVRSGSVWRRLLACCLFSLAGCGGLKLVPVSGTAMLGDKPIPSGGFCFTPDIEKGNNAHVVCVGRIGPDGRYEVKTATVNASQGGPGAPLGWYKVTYIDLRNSPAIKVNSKYLSNGSTPLLIEIVTNPKPGQYDIKLDD